MLLIFNGLTLSIILNKTKQDFSKNTWFYNLLKQIMKITALFGL